MSEFYLKSVKLFIYFSPFIWNSRINFINFQPLDNRNTQKEKVKGR
jgi:hypothetical protein